jgi:hypothetical protein
MDGEGLEADTASLAAGEKGSPAAARKTRKKQGIGAAIIKMKPPTFAEARKLAVEKGRADSAPTPAPEIAPRMTPPNRRAWSGKSDDLTKPTTEKPCTN